MQSLHSSQSPINVQEPVVQNWLEALKKDEYEQYRLKDLATEVVRTFKRESKDAKTVAEVIHLVPVLDKEVFRELLKEFHSGISQSQILDIHLLDGLAEMIRRANPHHLDPDDLVKILGLLSERLSKTHRRSSLYIYKLTLTVSQVLDTMVDNGVKDLDREKLHEPLSLYLESLEQEKDPYLVYQAAYAYQALLCVPDNETTLQTAMRRTGKVIHGFSELVSAVKALDIIKFIGGLRDIQKGFAGTSPAIQEMILAHDWVLPLVEDGKNFTECLKKSCCFSQQRAWYSALRGADTLIRDGKLTSFRELVCGAPCRRDPGFQWGVCQRLGEIAANSSWDEDTRRSAIAFLGELYRCDMAWGVQICVKRWILNILAQLASLSENESKCKSVIWTHSIMLTLAAANDLIEFVIATCTVLARIAELLLKEFQLSWSREKHRDCACEKINPDSYQLKANRPELGSPSLLERVQNRPDVEDSLRQLKKQRSMERGNNVYIPPQAKANVKAADDTRFPLMDKVKEFLESDHKVFLLRGDSGAGKSTFSRELEYDLWQLYKDKNDRIPLFINLPAIQKPEHDMIAKQLRKVGFTDPQIRELKHYRKFILLCDGYDESQQTHNLYMSNRLNQQGEWKAQMVISCRTEYLGSDYRDRFQPGDRNRPFDPASLQEAIIAPFSNTEVQSYIKQYVSVMKPLWKEEDYEQALENIPSLEGLTRNPFLMTLSLEVLPRIMDPDQHLAAAQVTRVALYDHFVEQWIERGKLRLGENGLSPQAKAAFDELSDEGFTQRGINFLKDLAIAIYKHQGGNPVVQYSRSQDEDSWKARFFNRDDENQLLREACPLARSGNQHRFIHRSLLEYGLALAIFDPQDWKEKEKAAPAAASNRRGTVSSVLSFECNDIGGFEPIITEQVPDINSPLAWKSFVKEPSILQFLQERVQQSSTFKDLLYSYIIHSKMDKKWRIAAANAITILVRAGVQFVDADLQGIQIPGADLSYGVFDSAKLEGADLRKVCLRGAWLRQADLRGARMQGVQFGESPFLLETDKVHSCAYSPDGKCFAVGVISGSIKVYSTSSWEAIQTLGDGHEEVRGIVFSPKGDQIASANHDNVRLWDVEQGVCRHTLDRHQRRVNNVAYSPQGDMVASASDDQTVRLWDVATGSCSKTLKGHDNRVISVTYSPKGNQIASGSWDHTVRLWEVSTGVCNIILIGHSNKVRSAVYSPQGDLIASASEDKTVRIWNAITGACRHVISGHINTVYSVAYSPDGSQIASGSRDGTVRLWDVETGTCRNTLTGHSDGISSVVYSPKGDYVASGSFDKSVRLWEVDAGPSHHFSSGHSMAVMSVKCSPNGDQIASGSMDNTIRLWDVETGACRRTIGGHSGAVLCVAYPPLKDQIASGGNGGFVRIWDGEPGKWRRPFEDHDDWVHDIAYSPTGDRIVSGSKDATLRIWDVETGACLTILADHVADVFSVAYSPCGKHIASGSKDRTVRLWDTGTKECSKVLHGHGKGVRNVVYSPLGDLLASASDDKTVRLWDMVTLKWCRTLSGHGAGVTSAAFSPPGDRLASGSDDRTVRLWDISSGDCLSVIQNFQSAINGVIWNTHLDSGYLVTGCSDGSVLMWDVMELAGMCRVRPRWSSTNGALTVTGATIHDVHGLSYLNRQLLNQRGATGEPVVLLRKPSTQVMTMAAVISNLRHRTSRDSLDFSSVSFVPDAEQQHNTREVRGDR